jgi:hypothetical protein
MIAWAVTVAAGLVVLVFAIPLFTGGVIDFWQRAGLTTALCGLMVAGVARLLGYLPNAWDLLFMVGLLLYFGRTYGGHLFGTLDGLDGVKDGRLRLPWLRLPPGVQTALRLALSRITSRLAFWRPDPSRDREEIPH